jgi:hypothetical protein
VTEEKIIDKIRGLLAKAEATEFEAEAVAFLDKATELMAKHRVSEAVLAAAGRAADDPVDRTTIDLSGYHSPKGSLAVHLAEALDCHVLWTHGGAKGAKRLEVVGHLSDLGTFEALMTSLELQLDRELLKVSGYNSGDTRARRTSFANGWVKRVGTRIKDHLADAVDDAVAEAEAADASSSVALVLAERRDVVADKYEEIHGRKPRYRTTRRSTSRFGAYAAGQAAGDRADIGTKGVSGARGAIAS